MSERFKEPLINPTWEQIVERDPLMAFSHYLSGWVHVGLFRGLHGVHLRCGLPARRTAEAARGLEGFDGFVTSAAAPIATGWSDQLPGGNRTR